MFGFGQVTAFGFSSTSVITTKSKARTNIVGDWEWKYKTSHQIKSYYFGKELNFVVMDSNQLPTVGH